MASDIHTTICPSTGKAYHYPRARYEDVNRTDQRRTGQRKGYQIAEMWDKHHEIARLLVTGMNNKEVAERVGCTAQTVSNVRNSPVVQDKLAILHAVRDVAAGDLAAEIRDLTPLALQRIREALETGSVLGREADARTILKEANNLLDREMGKAIQRVDSRNLNATLDLNDIDAIKRRAAELNEGII